MRELSGRKKAAFYRQFIGHAVRVLFEQREDAGLYTGLSDNYMKVGVATDAEIANQLLSVRLHRVERGMAIGALLALPA